MGSPTSDDDPTKRVHGPADRGPGGPPAHPPPGQGGTYGQGQPQQDQETTRFAQQPGEAQRGQTARFPLVGGGYPPGGQYPQGPGGQYPQGPGGQYPQG